MAVRARIRKIEIFIDFHCERNVRVRVRVWVDGMHCMRVHCVQMHRRIHFIIFDTIVFRQRMGDRTGETHFE